jgi:hypothetical protein
VANDTVEGVFVRDVKPEKETIITSTEGQFVVSDEVALLYLPTAIIQTTRRGESDPSISNFSRLWLDLGLRGKEIPKRNWIDAVELGPAEFIYSFHEWKLDQLKLKRWTSEAIKRFGSSVITIAYALTVLALSLSGVGMRRELSWQQAAIFAAIAANHTIIMIATDGIITADVRLAWLILFVIVAELAGGILLLRSAVRTV